MSVPVSAGVRQLMVQGPAPESPTLRTRQALTRPLGTDEQLVTEFDRSLLSLTLALGVIILLGLPGTAGWALGLLVGIDMVFGGCALMAVALAARKQA